MSILAELKRRNVFRAAIAYGLIAWVLMQVGDTLAPALRLPEWTTSLLAFFLILGFPLAIFFAWTYEMTPDGLRLERDATDSAPHAGRGALNVVIIAGLALALGYLVYDKFSSETGDVASNGTPATLASHRQAIAVLPFVNLSPDPDQEYFADGLTEEVLNLLARISALRVTSRSSVFYYKNKDIRISDIGQELGVSHILEGSVRKSGNQLRVTAQLIDVATDTHLWSHTWDRRLDNIFAIQDEIAAEVSHALEIQLVDELPVSYVTSPDAYSLYLRALEQAAEFSPSRLEEAVSLLERVLEIDPDYGPALVRISDVLTTLGGFEFRPLIPSFEQAVAYAERAIDAVPDYSGAYSQRATIAFRFDRDYPLARRLAERALALDPNDLQARARLELLNYLEGRDNAYVAAYRDLVVVDPWSVPAHRGLGHALMYSRRYGEAAEVFRKIQSINPESIVAHTSLGQALFMGGRLEEALAEFEQEPMEGFRFYGLTIVHYLMGNQAESDAYLEAFLNVPDAVTYAAQLAEAYAIRGEVDEAFEWLEFGFDRYDQGLVITPVNPKLDNLRDDPRFDAFAKRLASGGR